MEKTLGHYKIEGRKKGARGGCFAGFLNDTGLPVFGGQNLIYCPIWWDTTKEAVQSVCDRIMGDFPEYECEPVQTD
jgi:hypothetical protein